MFNGLGLVSIRGRLIAGCATLMMVTVAVASLQWFATAQLAETARESLLADAQAESLLLNIDRDSYQAQIAIEQLASARTEEMVAELTDGYTGNRDQTLSRWEDYTSIARGLGDERDRWPAYIDARELWVAHNDALTARMQAGDRSDDPTLVSDLVISRSLHDGLRGVLDGIVEEIYVPQHESFAAKLASDLDRTQLILPIGLLVGVVASTLVALLLAHNIARPIGLIADRARRIAAGDLKGAPLELSRRDELGDLAARFDEMSRTLQIVEAQALTVAEGELTSDVLNQRVPGQLGTAFESMIGSLRSVIRQLTDSAEGLTGSAAALSAASSTMNASAEQTSSEASTASETGDAVSSNIAGVSQAMDAMSSSIREIAQSATEASAVAEEAVEVAANSSTMIGRLGDSSEQIGAVIEVINTIAEQTNLLALNATIEAARAGSAGKGFAVVASEVKQLASETSQATDEISSRILAIQSDTTAAIEATEEIGETIERIRSISTTIAAAVEEQSITTAGISGNIEAANTGAQQIASSIAQVAGAADGTRRSTAEATESADDVRRLATELTDLVGAFR